MKKVTLMAMVLVMVGVSAKSISASLLESLAGKVTYVVAQDGSGKFKTVKEAIDSANVNEAKKIVIFIKNGEYYEKVEIPKERTGITLVGEDWEKTVIWYDDYVGKGKYKGINTKYVDSTISLGTCHTMFAWADDFTLINLSVKNPQNINNKQAVTLDLNADKHMVLHCKLLGNQDCLYTWGKGRFYFKDSYIEGTVDFICGRGAALFENTTIHCKRDKSFIAAASTDQNWKFGYVFKNCKITAASDVKEMYLGRPWKTYSQMVYISCEEGAFIKAEGWSPWGGPANTDSSLVAEYKCTGPGAGTSRVSWSKQLSDEEAAKYTMSNIFAANVNATPFSSNWDPDLANNEIYKIVYKHLGLTGVNDKSKHTSIKTSQIQSQTTNNYYSLNGSLLNSVTNKVAMPVVKQVENRAQNAIILSK